MVTPVDNEIGLRHACNFSASGDFTTNGKQGGLVEEIMCVVSR